MCLQSIIKRPNRLMNSNFGLVSCHFFFPSSLVWTYFCFIILLRIFICLFCTCNISLYCIHTKNDKYYIHLQKKKKNDKYCTNFANVYNICQFLCVYNINLHCKYNVCVYIYIYIYIYKVNEKWNNGFFTIVLVCSIFTVS